MSDDRSGYPGAPPGWYPDPAGGSGSTLVGRLRLDRRRGDAGSTAAPAGGSTARSWADRLCADWCRAHRATPAGFLPGVRAAGTRHLARRPTARQAPGCSPRSARISRLARVAVVIAGRSTSWSAFINLRAESALYRRLGHQYHRLIIAGREQPTGAAHHVRRTRMVNGGIVALGLRPRSGRHRRGGGRLHLAVPRRVDRPRAGPARPSIRRDGAWVRGSCPSSTTGCRIRPSGTAWPRTTPRRGVVLQWWFFVDRGRAILSGAAVAALFSTALALAVSIPRCLLCPGRAGHRAPIRHAPLRRRTEAAVAAGGSETPVTGVIRRKLQLFTLRFHSGYQQFISTLYGPH